ncbi:DUF342 domain-containing protein [Microbacterium sp. 4R-513]|uniref:DUF342 domain-containing protein n=1 Tax=Microbacterium sp. 4R-513 TaxID=2567934 RepID=UPI0013E197DC|nr:DUF342 domain-containing protein [Microbacterium sp. 4R-513]QIG40936.1 DUF342 domain-containing protein [Microbacterium sp. 4R-513]
MIQRLLARAKFRSDESGAILVTVVVVMFVGFIVAATIAASVMFTIGANDTNKDRTEAFIAAESGRDVGVAAVTAGCTATTLTGTNPTYTTKIYSTSGTKPTSATDAGVTLGCPSSTSKYVVFRTTGTGPDGATTTIDSVYPWTVTYSNVPGGVVTYFSGSVSQSVSHYTGDLVLRNGNWACPNGGTLDGDLYVLNGTVSLSTGCIVNGDIYASGNVSSNSQSWHVNARAGSTSAGNITTNGTVSFDANGNPTVAGYISAKGNIKLNATGGGAATVGGTVTTKGTAVVDLPAWTTGAVTQNSPSDPVFDPTLAWLRAATKWIDLDGASSWGTSAPINCASDLQNANTATAKVKPLLSSGTTPLVLNFSGCTKDVKLDLTGSVPVTRNVVVISPKDQGLTISLGGLTAAAGSNFQLLFVHADGNRDDRDASGDPKPTCGSSGTRNAQDGFGTTGSIASNISVMIYSPCGLSGTVTASFAGQLYTDDTTNFHSGSAYTCKPMSWGTALPSLGCTIKGSGGIIDSSTLVQRLDGLVYQSEK